MELLRMCMYILVVIALCIRHGQGAACQQSDNVLQMCEAGTKSGKKLFLDASKAVGKSGSCRCTLTSTNAELNLDISMQGGVPSGCLAVVDVGDLNYMAACGQPNPGAVERVLKAGTESLMILLLRKDTKTTSDFCIQVEQKSPATDGLKITCTIQNLNDVANKAEFKSSVDMIKAAQQATTVQVNPTPVVQVTVVPPVKTGGVQATVVPPIQATVVAPVKTEGVQATVVPPIQATVVAPVNTGGVQATVVAPVNTGGVQATVVAPVKTGGVQATVVAPAIVPSQTAATVVQPIITPAPTGAAKTVTTAPSGPVNTASGNISAGTINTAVPLKTGVSATVVQIAPSVVGNGTVDASKVVNIETGISEELKNGSTSDSAKREKLIISTVVVSILGGIVVFLVLLGTIVYCGEKKKLQQEQDRARLAREQGEQPRA